MELGDSNDGEQCDELQSLNVEISHYKIADMELER